MRNGWKAFFLEVQIQSILVVCFFAVTAVFAFCSYCSSEFQSLTMLLLALLLELVNPALAIQVTFDILILNVIFMLIAMVMV